MDYEVSIMNRAVQVISENIGIQHALAEYKNALFIPAPDYLVVSFPILSNEKVSEAEYQQTLEEVFENASRIDTYDNRYFYRVSVPKEEYLEAFEKCADNGMLNKWINYFAVRGLQGDANERERIKLSAKQEAADMTGDEEWEEFVQYMKDGIMANAGRFGLSVPGFTIEELKTDRYIGALVKRFQTVTIIVFDYEWKDVEVFYKSLEFK